MTYHDAEEDKVDAGEIIRQRQRLRGLLGLGVQEEIRSVFNHGVGGSMLSSWLQDTPQVRSSLRLAQTKHRFRQTEPHRKGALFARGWL